MQKALFGSLEDYKMAIISCQFILFKDFKKRKILVFVNFMNILLEKNQLEEKTVLTIKHLIQVATHLVSQKNAVGCQDFCLDLCVFKVLASWLNDKLSLAVISHVMLGSVMLESVLAIITVSDNYKQWVGLTAEHLIKLTQIYFQHCIKCF